MGKIVKGLGTLIRGGAAAQSGGTAQMVKQQAEQKLQLEASQRRASAIEEGQSRVRSGAGGGLAGYLDERLGFLLGG